MVREEQMNTEMNEAELAREAYLHRRDLAEWIDEEEQIVVRPARTAVISCRLPLDEMETLEDAAREAGEKLSEFVRKAVTLRIGVRHPRAQISVVANTATEENHPQTTWSYRNTPEESNAPYSTVLPAPALVPSGDS
jgi:hypothetical protein